MVWCRFTPLIIQLYITRDATVLSTQDLQHNSECIAVRRCVLQISGMENGKSVTLLITWHEVMIFINNGASRAIT